MKQRETERVQAMLWRKPALAEDLLFLLEAVRAAVLHQTGEQQPEMASRDDAEIDLCTSVRQIPSRLKH